MSVRAVPLADASALRAGRRRAGLLRALAFVAVGCLAAAVAVAAAGRHGTAGAAGAAVDRSTVVLLDVSGSITPGASKTIVTTLRDVARGGGHAGIVLFSDDTEEVLPPTAPASELLQYVRLFDPHALSQNPWAITFSAGTQIGKGLAAAHDALTRAGIQKGRVVLVSDVDDSTADTPLMRRELLAYARDPAIQLRVALVPYYNEHSAALYGRVLGQAALAHRRPPLEAAVSRGSGTQILPLALAVAAVLALAVHELLSAPLAWREAPA